MDYNKENFNTWGEAARWMQKHGYGIEQIRIEEENWKEKTVSAAQPVQEPVNTPKPAPKEPVAVKPVAKTITTTATKTK